MNHTSVCVAHKWMLADFIACLENVAQEGSAATNNINDIIWRSLIKAGVPTRKEPVGLSRSDGKLPDGLTLIPWCSGRCAVWDVTVVDTLAKSYIHLPISTFCRSSRASRYSKNVEISEPV